MESILALLLMILLLLYLVVPKFALATNLAAIYIVICIVAAIFRIFFSKNSKTQEENQNISTNNDERNQK